MHKKKQRNIYFNRTSFNYLELSIAKLICNLIRDDNIILHRDCFGSKFFFSLMEFDGIHYKRIHLQYHICRDCSDVYPTGQKRCCMCLFRAEEKEGKGGLL